MYTNPIDTTPIAFVGMHPPFFSENHAKTLDRMQNTRFQAASTWYAQIFEFLEFLNSSEIWWCSCK